MIKFLDHQLKCRVDEIDFCVGEGKLTHRILSISTQKVALAGFTIAMSPFFIRAK